jgi:cholesterol transport system auxiliary component
MKPVTVLLLAFWLPAAGCALTTRGATLTPRYFSPVVEEKAGSTAPGVPPASFPELRLGQIEAASHLEERMAYRVSPSELGYYEDRRWTEQPYEYVRRALERELFERRHVRRVVTGAADTLDVELTAFEELRTPTPHVRLALTYVLHDEHESRLEQSVAIERSLPPGTEADRAERVARALGAALGDAVTSISDAVTRDLRTVSTPSDGDAAPPSREALRPARNER